MIKLTKECLPNYRETLSVFILNDILLIRLVLIHYMYKMQSDSENHLLKSIPTKMKLSTYWVPDPVICTL